MRTRVATFVVGGIDEATLTANESAASLKNVVAGDAGGWETCPGSGDYVTPEGTASVTADWERIGALAWFEQQGGGQQWVSAELHVVGETDARWIALRPSAAGFPWQLGAVTKTRLGAWFVQVGDWLWCLNGTDRPRRWNGDVVEAVGFDRRPPSPQLFSVGEGVDEFDELAFWPSATVAGDATDPRQLGVGSPVQRDASGKLFVPWRYGYAISFVNDLGHESPLSEIAWVNGWSESSGVAADITPSKRLVHVHVPRGPIEARGVRIYRTQTMILPPPLASGGADGIAWDKATDVAPPPGVFIGAYYDQIGRNMGAAFAAAFPSSAPLYLLEEYASAIEFVHVDGAPDGQLGLPPSPQLGLVPTGLRLAVLHAGRMFGAGSEAGTLFYSAPGFVEQWPAMNYLRLPGGPITALAEAFGRLFAFTERAVHVVTASEVPRVETISADVGAVGPRCVADVPGVGLCFLGPDGPYAVTAEGDASLRFGVRYLGRALARTWSRRVNRSALHRACVGVHHRAREVWWQVPSGDSPDPDLGLVLHYGAGGTWSLREGFAAAGFAETADQRRLLLYGSSTVGEGIRVIAPGYDSAAAGGDSIESELVTAWVPMAGLFDRDTSPQLFVHHVASGRSIASATRADHRVAWDDGSALPDGMPDEAPRPAWGSAVWGTDAWTDHSPAFVRADFDVGSAYVRQWRLTGTRFAPLAVGITASPAPPPGGIVPTGRTS